MLNKYINIDALIKSFYDLSIYIKNPIVKYRYTNLIKKYSKILSNLEFDFNTNSFNNEYYEYIYTFDNNPSIDSLKVYWNIEKLIDFGVLNHCVPVTLNINQLRNNIYIDKTINIDNDFVPKDTYIIIASLITPQYNYILIDGNHRINFCIKNNINEIQAIILPFFVHYKFINDDSTRMLVSIINNINIFLAYYVNKTIDKNYFDTNFVKIPILPFVKNKKL